MAETKKAVKKAEPKKVESKKVSKPVVTPEEKAFNAFFKKNADKLKNMRTAEEKCKVAFMAGLITGVKAAAKASAK